MPARTSESLSDSCLELTTQEMYLIINISDVHHIIDIVIKVRLQNSPQDVESDVWSAKKCAITSMSKTIDVLKV